MTLIPFERGKALVWDATVVDTLAPSYVDAGSSSAGAAGSRAEARKLQKYSDLTANYLVAPLAFETLGAPAPATSALLDTVGQLIEETTGCKRAREYLLQRLSLEVQRGNAAAVMGTMASYRGPPLEMSL